MRDFMVTKWQTSLPGHDPFAPDTDAGGLDPEGPVLNEKVFPTVESS